MSPHLRSIQLGCVVGWLVLLLFHAIVKASSSSYVSLSYKLEHVSIGCDWIHAMINGVYLWFEPCAGCTKASTALINLCWVPPALPHISGFAAEILL